MSKTTEVTRDQIRVGDRVTATYSDGTEITGTVTYAAHGAIGIGETRRAVSNADKYERHGPEWHKARVVYAGGRAFVRQYTDQQPWRLAEVVDPEIDPWRTDAQIAALGDVRILVNEDGTLA